MVKSVHWIDLMLFLLLLSIFWVHPLSLTRSLWRLPEKCWLQTNWFGNSVDAFGSAAFDWRLSIWLMCVAYPHICVFENDFDPFGSSTVLLFGLNFFSIPDRGYRWRWIVFVVALGFSYFTTKIKLQVIGSCQRHTTCYAINLFDHLINILCMQTAQRFNLTTMEKADEKREHWHHFDHVTIRTALAMWSGVCAACHVHLLTYWWSPATCSVVTFINNKCKIGTWFESNPFVLAMMCF